MNESGGTDPYRRSDETFSHNNKKENGNQWIRAGWWLDGRQKIISMSYDITMALW